MNEALVEHLGFTPVQFLDEVINIVNEQLYRSLQAFESSLKREICNEKVFRTNQCMQEIETLFERSIDSRFDRFELYVLKNILKLDKNVILPSLENLNHNLTLKEDEQLDLELKELNCAIKAEEMKRRTLVKKELEIRSKMNSLVPFKEKLDDIQKVADEHGLCFTDINEISDVIKDTETIMNRIQEKTKNVNWETVPLIGKRDLKVEVSSWETAGLYKDVKNIAKSKDVQAINALYQF